MYEGKFEDYKNMIMERAHYVSKKYGVDFDEMVSVGYEVYVNSLRTFNEEKGAKFGTYLYIQLNEVANEAKRIRKRGCSLFSEFESDEDEDFDFSDYIGSIDYNINNDELIEKAKSELSFEAFRLFKWAISFSWQNWDKQRVANIPTKKMAIKGCGFSRDVVESAWGECESFWNKLGVVA